MREVRSSGLVDYLNFLTSSLVWRIPFEDFQYQFHALYPEGYDPCDNSAQENCEEILNALEISLDSVQYGRTRVYLERKDYQFLVSKLLQVQSIAAEVIQASVRAKLAGEAYTKQLETTEKLQPIVRGLLARNDFNAAKKQHERPGQAPGADAAQAAAMAEASSDEWTSAQTQQERRLAQEAIDNANDILAKFNVPEKEGPTFMAQSFNDLANPDGVITKEIWEAQFGKGAFDEYNKNDDGVIDRDEWEETFQSHAVAFLSKRMQSYYEGRLVAVQMEVTDMEKEVSDRKENLEGMLEADNHMKALNEAEVRRKTQKPEWERAMMASEEAGSSKVSVLEKAESRMAHLAELVKHIETVDDNDSSLTRSAHPQGFINSKDVTDVVNNLVQDQVRLIHSSGVTPDMEQKNKKAFDELQWKYVEELLERRENEARLQGRMRQYTQTGNEAVLANPNSAEAVAAEIEAEALDSQDKLDKMMEDMMADFGMKPEDTDKAPAHQYRDKYDYKYKHNKLETMSIH